jgi:DEAD/DEAH box helicase domain-containing protein
MKDFLRVSFWSSTPGFDSMLERFLDGADTVGVGQHGESPLFRGPYVSLKLRFQDGQSGPDYFPKVPMKFPPYRHQEQAFARLGGQDKKSTLVATGTGSGKTESFLYPILAHCEQYSNRPGVKAILVYPMNALAGDQAERLAAAIYKNENLRGKVTAGLYVGSQERAPHGTMGKTHLLTDKSVIREHPPDILLTNYKMLDYLLARPRDQKLWRDNDPDTLQYLVVDELHTFDGAQGTDLACLIRRLKARLLTPEGHLCCVGTSATMGGDTGGGTSSRTQLVDYAEQIFGEVFEDDAVVTEARVPADEFLPLMVDHFHVPSESEIQQLDPERYQDAETYVRRQQELWFDTVYEPVKLGKELAKHTVFQSLVRMATSEPKSFEELVSAFARQGPLREGSRRHIRLALVSILTLTSYARRTLGPNRKPETNSEEPQEPQEQQAQQIAPLVELRVQLWQREMRRMVASVGDRPALRFYDDLTREQRKLHLPVIYCRECGTMGWATMVDKDKKSDLSVNLKSLYQAYFAYDPRVKFMFPADGGPKGLRYAINTGTLMRKGRADTEEDDGETLVVVIPENTHKTKRGLRSHHDCPMCEASDSLSLIGFQAATLTSAYINQLFASGFNDDKKLLTFSDSVQDAAHRAGFFGARTWQFNLRIAMQKVIDKADGPVPLGELSHRVAEYWREHLSSDEEYVSTFIPPNLMWLRDFEEMTETGKLGKKSNLPLLIEKRLSWEAFGEFTLNSRIGRSLTRTGASVASVNPELREQALDAMLETLKNEVGGLRELSKAQLRPFVLGLLRHLIERGAVYQPELDESYLSTGGQNTYVMSQKRTHLPDFGPRSHLPGFLASRSGTRRFEALHFKSKKSWFDLWFARCMESVHPLAAEQSREAYEVVLDMLVKSGVVERRTYGGTHVWGLRPEALEVTGKVASLRCSKTAQEIVVPEAELEHWQGVPNLGARLDGVYEAAEQNTFDYYARLYRDGQIQRIIAREHTGLLERDDREDLESRFKADDPKPWYPNLLSCTPTLEMGIDVGDLSTAVLCSVPPSQANYLQRIGRAGRRDGNSLLLTLAAAKPHDLYFFNQPDEMIAGGVDTPGVFLNASAVLERQLTAFCFDRWAASGVEPGDLPRTLGLFLDRLSREDKTHFPHNFLEHIKTHETTILEDFLALFDEHLSEQSREHLVRFMRGGEDEGSLRWKILNGLQGEQHDSQSHRREIKRLTKKINDLEKEKVLGKDEEEDLENMKREKSALQSLVRTLEKRETLNFFTDEGLIPNYAFPEAGVTLKSIIWRRKKEVDSGQGKYETQSYEYERPAGSAIRELAPRNRFYAGGRQVSIDRIDVDQGTIEKWQFCDNCNFVDKIPAGKSEYKACPACGSPGFGDVAGQVRNMLRLRQVYANASDRRSRIADEREERQPMFYNQQMLVRFDNNDVGESLALDDESVPFGYEYIKKTSFREINFGEYSDQGEKLSIAGVQSIRQGFGVCADCGTIQPRSSEKDREHTYGCLSRSRNHREEIVDCLFLYREFASESIRMLLPFVDRPGYQSKLHSFVAALQMGLKDYFSGQIDHLKTTTYSEPGPEESTRKQFLIIYDSVPGGTGYLKELMRGEDGERPIFEVFRRALEHLKNCSCQRQDGQDGCYKCLYAYRNSYEMEDTSRKAAIEVLNGIIELEDSLATVESLGDIKVNGLFDSALEARFVEALRRKDDVELLSRIVENKPGYRLRTQIDLQTQSDLQTKSDERISWNVIPQEKVTEADGALKTVEIDTLFKFARRGDEHRKVAAFTDGFEFHADRIAKDLYQRMGLVRTGDYWTWSLTWHDVEQAFKEQERFFVNLTEPKAEGLQEVFYENIYKFMGGGELRHATGETSLQWLERLLRKTPEAGEEAWKCWAFAMASAYLDPQSQDGGFEEWRGELAEVAPLSLVDFMGEESSGALFGRFGIGEDNGSPLKVFAIASQGGLNSKHLSAIRVVVWLDDREETRQHADFRKAWNGFLRLYNLLQFLPHTFFITETGKAQLDYSALLPKGDEPAGELTGAWKAVRDQMVVVPRSDELVEELFELGCPLPTPGHELEDDNGTTLGPLAELAWPDQRVALVEVLPNDPAGEDAIKAFKSHGWKVADIEEMIDQPAAVLELLEK